MTGYSKAGRQTGAQLNEVSVRRIRLRLSKGETPRNLADEYKLAIETIRRIGRWETWRWVSAEGEGAQPQEWNALPELTPAQKDAAADFQARVQARLAAEGVGQREIQKVLDKPTGEE